VARKQLEVELQKDRRPELKEEVDKLKKQITEIKTGK
jgi:hypothetical protein